jgi:hypothetical protein
MSVIEWVSKQVQVHTGWPTSICWVGGWVGWPVSTSLVQGQLLMGPARINFFCALSISTKCLFSFSQWYGSLSKAKIRTWISSVGLIFDQTKCLISYMIHHLRHTQQQGLQWRKNDFSSCNEYDSNCGPRLIKVNTVMPPSSLISKTLELKF